MNSTATIYCERLDETKQITHTAKLFGSHFPMKLEPLIFNMARMLSTDYRGGIWHFNALSNDAFYTAPAMPEVFTVKPENGNEVKMSADALGITTCLYAYCHLSFTALGEFSKTCARQYHLLLNYAFEHPEAKCILKAID